MNQTRRRRLRLSLLLALLMLITLAASACTFQVQPIEDYTTEDGYLSLAFPAAWDVLEENSSNGTTMLLVGSDPTIMETEDAPPGAAVFVVLMPSLLPGTGPEGRTQDVKEMADIARADMIGAPNTETGEVEPAILASGVEAYKFSQTDPNAEGAVYTFSPSEGILAMAIIAVARGAEDISLQDAQQVISSIRFNGDPVEFAARALEIMGNGGQ